MTRMTNATTTAKQLQVRAIPKCKLENDRLTEDSEDNEEAASALVPRRFRRHDRLLELDDTGCNTCLSV